MCREILCRSARLKELETCLCDVRLCAGKHLNHRKTAFLIYVLIHIEGHGVAVHAHIYPVFLAEHLPVFTVCRYEHGLVTALLRNDCRKGRQLYGSKVRLWNEDFRRLGAGGCQKISPLTSFGRNRLAA